MRVSRSDTSYSMEDTSPPTGEVNATAENSAGDLAYFWAVLAVLAVLLVIVLCLRPTFRVHDPLRSAVLVTGTSSGIGRATALAFGAAGYRKVFCGVRQLADAPIEYSTCIPIVLDVSKPEQLAAAVAEVQRQVQADGTALAGIVMNAGVTSMGPLELLAVQEMRQAFEVNVFGLMAVVQAFLPLLRASHGRLILIGSEAGMISPIFYGSYAATKHALEALADSLRAELLPSSVAVSLLQVGCVATRIEAKMRSQLETSVAVAEGRHQTSPPPVDGRPGGNAFEGYARRLKAFLRLIEFVARLGVLPSSDAPTGAVLHAMQAPRPRCRYLVGAEAWLVWGVLRFLPSHLVDWVMLVLFRP